ncbi:MAG TPA: hypothetical protein VKB38_16885 [Terracidiphilus sp.]|nr:hypothetical protein [Terracidiphilus sp.]
MVGFVASLAAQAPERSDLDSYKWRVDTNWWFSNPTGFFEGRGETDEIDLHRDLGFGSYSTFSGKVDWHITRRQHIVMGISPVVSNRTTTLSRTIEYQGATYDLGAQIKTHIGSLSFSPGYQFDIVRRNGNYIGLLAQCFLLNTNVDITGTATVNGQTGTRTSSGSVFAPIPVIGTEGRWYPSSESSRFSIDGHIEGMYLFGYGDFLSAGGSAGIRVQRHIDVRAGYQLGTRLSIHGSDNRIGLRLSQKGPLAGLEFTW